MKTKKAFDLCKKRNTVFLYNGDEAQWISDGCAVYPLFGLPVFNKETLFKTNDITDKQAASINFMLSDELPPNICFEDIEPGEQKVERLPIGIGYRGMSLIPFKTSTGIEFISAKYLTPLEDIDGGLLDFYERRTKGGATYFAVKTGMLIVAIIQPAEVISAGMVAELALLAKMCETSLENKLDKQNEENTQEGLNL